MNLQTKSARRSIARMALILLVLVAILLPLACGHGVQAPAEEPAWVQRGAGLYRGPVGLAFYGVGASQLEDPEAARGQAATLARAALARVFKVKIEASVSISAEEGKSGSIESIADTSEIFSSAVLRGSRIVAHHQSPGGPVFALVALGPEELARHDADGGSESEGARAKYESALSELEKREPPQ